MTYIPKKLLLALSQIYTFVKVLLFDDIVIYNKTNIFKKSNINFFNFYKCYFCDIA